MKILMVTMALDIGGAETHITELSKALVKRGHTVVVASNGGVYESELQKNGIRHVRIPLHRKRSAVRAYFELRRLISDERKSPDGGFDIVHAHARIPAFMCGLLSRTLKFRFVTTCHGVYDITPMWRRISDWGEYTLAVSRDVKTYLIREYGLPSDNIKITTNGIDTDRFSAGTNSEKIEKSLELTAPRGRRILYISRIDKASSHVAFMLCEAAPELAKLYPDAQIVIVGGGDVFDKLTAAADSANSEIGRKFVVTAGASTDIPMFVSWCDVFVGVSRALLEAMSAQKPVILAGSQGYIGIIGKCNHDIAAESNYCGRGCGFCDADKLVHDISTVLEMPEDEKSTLGAFGRETVIRDFSIERMTDDAERMYLLCRPTKLYSRGDMVLSGYYGFGNSGDDLLLQTIVKSIRDEDPDSKITVLSKTPRATAKRYHVRSIYRFDLPKIYREFGHAKILINGGGTLISNNTSTRSLLYYLKIMNIAKHRGLKTMLYGSGIGPVFGDSNRRKAARALKSADCLALRETASLLEAEQMCGVKLSACVTADPAFLAEIPPLDETEYVLRREGINDIDRRFAISVRPWKENAPDFEDRIVDACRMLEKSFGLKPLFIAMQHDYDFAICGRLAERTGGTVLSEMCASELIGIIGKCKFTVGMRLHSVIYSAIACRPAICLSYDPKVDALCDAMKLPYNIPVSEIDDGKLFGYAEKIMENYGAEVAHIKDATDKMREAAKLNSELLFRLIK